MVFDRFERNWRNKQLGNSTAILNQEQYCWDFMLSHGDIIWNWNGVNGRFQQLCFENFKIGTRDTATGIIIINRHQDPTPKQFVDFINSQITATTSAIYLALNRFNFAAINDLNIVYKDKLSDSIDQIVSHIKLPLKRMDIGIAEELIDGHHFVGVHGLDIFTYESNS